MKKTKRDRLTFNSWRSIFNRCNRKKCPQYKRYGGRGIRVCERWSKYENFLEDMGQRPSKLHSLDRIDNNGNYERSNCRWATVDVQVRNRRSNINVVIDGKVYCSKDAERLLGLSEGLISQRKRLGWKTDKLTKPIQKIHTKITYNGKTQTANQWEKEYGLGSKTLMRRLGNGWTIENALKGKK